MRTDPASQPPRRRPSALQLALGVSVIVHAALLLVRFADPQSLSRAFKDTPLEVILVNTKSSDSPQKAAALAQASLAGAGQALRGRSTSPLPPSERDRSGDAAQDEQDRRIETLKEQQNQLLAQVRQQLAAMPLPEHQVVNPSPQTIERERKRQALVKILAEIEKRINEENARPKKRYISPATQQAVYAIYYDELRRKIEERGTDNFPRAAGQKLYGELIMSITVNHSGDVLHTEVVQPSGNGVLDRQAQAIVRGLTFGRFSDEMRRQADQIVVVTRFRFSRDQTLKTEFSTP